MKRLLFILSIFILSGSLFSDEILKTKDGIYRQAVGQSAFGRIFEYIADPSTQLCFFAILDKEGRIPISITTIPSEALAKKEEWKSIITWIKKTN
jgi:hypothetical protein